MNSAISQVTGRLLLVDEDLESVQCTVRLFKSANFDVYTASSVEECLLALHQHHPDIVLLHFPFRGSIGPEICRLIKSGSTAHPALVVLVSRLGATCESESAALQIGADGYIQQPVSDPELISRIESLLRIRQATEALPDAQSECDPLVIERTAALDTASLLRIEIDGRKRAETRLLEEIAQRERAEEALLNSQAEIKALKDRLQGESDYLMSEAKVTRPPGMVIGESKAMSEVLQLVQQVARTPSSVLIVGETGTGKELIADSIHQLGARKQLPIVKVNCAALPSALVESELFGRERGAYTGALTRQIGRFEAADRSTIFLDEVGELSLGVQAKLLRVLQEGRFERLGNPKPFKVDVRVIAATNRDLAGQMRKGCFREDLFYRLNVFPIKVPPLRERPEDIPVLVWAFLEEFCSRMGKKITKVPQKAMDRLQRHDWPGNVRQLRNVLEHGVIISRGEVLRIPPLEDSAETSEEIMTLAETEREHILRTLEVTHWRIKGSRGAAERLGMRPSTLYSRMGKLGIPTRREKDEAQH